MPWLRRAGKSGCGCCRAIRRRWSSDYGFRVRPFFRQLLEPAAARRAWLAERGLTQQVVGTWPDIFGHGLPAEQARSWHRLLNDTLAEWCAEHGFAWIASVPLPSAEDATAELERAVARAVGAILPTNVEGANLGELALDRFWAIAETLDAPVLLHPVMTTPAPRARRFALAQIAQYTFDTTLVRRLADLLRRAGPLSAPALILSHGGGDVSVPARPFRLHARAHGPGGAGRRRAGGAVHLCRAGSTTTPSCTARCTCAGGEAAARADGARAAITPFPPADLDPARHCAQGRAYAGADRYGGGDPDYNAPDFCAARAWLSGTETGWNDGSATERQDGAGDRRQRGHRQGASRWRWRARASMSRSARAARSRSKRAASEIAKATGRKIVADPGRSAPRPPTRKTFIKQAHEALGRIDIMVNNAGSAPGGVIEHLTEDDWAQGAAAQVHGLCALPARRAADHGQAGRRPRRQPDRQ